MVSTPSSVLADAAAPAREMGPADHDDRDGGELVAHARLRVALLLLRRLADSGPRRASMPEPT